MAIVAGRAKWCRLLTPSKEEGPFKSKYSIDLFVSPEDAKKLKAEGLETKVEKETNEEFFRFWTSGKRKDGTLNPPVRLIDSKKNAITEEPGNGSLVKVQYQATEWEFLKKKGMFGALQGVMVTKLISRSAADEFEAEDEVSSEFEDDIAF